MNILRSVLFAIWGGLWTLLVAPMVIIAAIVLRGLWGYHFGIFGHGNVTCLSEALEAVKETLPHLGTTDITGFFERLEDIRIDKDDPAFILVDLNRLAREELANRGYDQIGTWVGFEQAERALKRIDAWDDGAASSEH